MKFIRMIWDCEADHDDPISRDVLSLDDASENDPVAAAELLSGVVIEDVWKDPLHPSGGKVFRSETWADFEEGIA